MTKYFSNAIEASVVVSRDAHLLRVNLSVHVGQGILLQGHADAADPHAAYEAAVERVAKRLRRHKRRLRDHHKNAPSELVSHPAQQYVLSSGDSAETGDEAEADEPDNPVIVAEMATRIETLTVGEAVMRLRPCGPARRHVSQPCPRGPQHDLSPERREHRLGRSRQRQGCLKSRI